jgi:AmiR/NasT family two-component response regulator
VIVLAHRVGLFFRARIAELARRAGAELVATAPQAALEDEALRVGPDLILLELERADLDEVRRLRRRPELAAARLVGFGAHVDEALFSRARAAGFDEVLAKGALGRRLEQLLRAGPG